MFQFSIYSTYFYFTHLHMSKKRKRNSNEREIKKEKWKKQMTSLKNFWNWSAQKKYNFLFNNFTPSFFGAFNIVCFPAPPVLWRLLRLRLLSSRNNHLSSTRRRGWRERLLANVTHIFYFSFFFSRCVHPPPIIPSAFIFQGCCHSWSPPASASSVSTFA